MKKVRAQIPKRVGFQNNPGQEGAYTKNQVEFLAAIQKFKEAGNPFPSWCQVLSILESLGYRKTAARSKE